MTDLGFLGFMSLTGRFPPLFLSLTFWSVGFHLQTGVSKLEVGKINLGSDLVMARKINRFPSQYVQGSVFRENAFFIWSFPRESISTSKLWDHF